MKRLVLLSILGLMATSGAFSAGMFHFGAHANYANLNVPDPLKSVYGAGFGGGLHVDYRFGFVSIRVSGDYSSFGADANALRNLIFDEAGGPSKTTVGVIIKFHHNTMSFLFLLQKGLFSVARVCENSAKTIQRLVIHNRWIEVKYGERTEESPSDSSYWVILSANKLIFPLFLMIA